MPKHQTNKVKARTSRILKAIQTKEDLDEVAKELGITRRALGYNMASYDFQSSLAEFLAKDMEDHYKTIREFLDSDDPAMRAEGMKEHGKMHRALVPKLTYKYSENENTTRVKLDATGNNNLSLEEQNKLAELLLKLEDGAAKAEPPKPQSIFIEGEYKVREPDGGEGADVEPNSK